MGIQDSPRLPQPVAHIFFRGCSDETRTELLSRLPFHSGDMLTEGLLQTAREAAEAIHERIGISISDAANPEERLRLPAEARSQGVETGVNVTIFDARSRPERIRVEAAQHSTMLLESVAPATAADGGATVRLAIVVGKDGSVVDAISLDGPDALKRPALEAVHRWRYRPTRLNGRPVEVQTTVELSFPAA